MILPRLFFLVILFSFCGMHEVQAEETEQFTLPPEKLFDIGPMASQRLFAVLEKVVAQTNEDIQRFLPKSQHSRYMASQLALRRNDVYLADLLYKKTGPGFPRWLRWYRVSKQSNPIIYKEIHPWKTVYWLVFSQSPLSLIGLAPTINMYGYYFGTDKLGHFFMQGHTYYKIYSWYLRRGKSAEQAHALIVKYGQILEETYLGTLINGVYSNGDLSANYAGWKFYLNLTHSVKIGEQTLPPILVLREGKWVFSKHINKNTLLKPYLSDNLNEAWNPCHYAFTRSQIRRQVKKRCPDWIKRRGLTAKKVGEKLAEIRLWHGEEYGHWLPARNAVTLDLCFGGR